MSTYRTGSRVPVPGTYMCLGCSTQVELGGGRAFPACSKGCLFPRFVLIMAREKIALDVPPDREGTGRGNPNRL